MSLHRERTTPTATSYSVVTRENAPHDIAVRITEPFALYLGTDSGDGLVIEGDLADIAELVDHIHTHVHRTIRDTTSYHTLPGHRPASTPR
ncbi:MAG: hypothetical protein INR66_11405 [Gordonia polyisoprenivorans]|nr:hypothetical protein [Gordonia polyisoprenivorans]